MCDIVASLSGTFYLDARRGAGDVKMAAITWRLRRVFDAMRGVRVVFFALGKSASSRFHKESDLMTPCAKDRIQKDR
jgi:hypothetical protein